MQQIPPPPAMFQLLQAQGLQLVDSPPETNIQPLQGGRNNRLWRLLTQTGPVVLKAYFPDARPRLETEWQFLTHAQTQGLRSVPLPLGQAPAERLALYSWEAGSALTPQTLTTEHIQQYLDFLFALNPPSSDISAFAPASDSCFSLVEHRESLAQRIARLQAATLLNAKAQTLLQTQLLPLWQESAAVLAKFRNQDQPIQTSQIWLSPSDVGFHNALLRPDGHLVFLDFEYAGRDHRLKTLADLMTSVGVPLPFSAYDQVERMLINLDTGEIPLFRALLPLHQLKWCCILMGLFSPAQASRRDFAGVLSEHMLVQQLHRLQVALDRTQSWLKLAQN